MASRSSSSYFSQMVVVLKAGRNRHSEWKGFGGFAAFGQACLAQRTLSWAGPMVWPVTLTLWISQGFLQHLLIKSPAMRKLHFRRTRSGEAPCSQLNFHVKPWRFCSLPTLPPSFQTTHPIPMFAYLAKLASVSLLNHLGDSNLRTILQHASSAWNALPRFLTGLVPSLVCTLNTFC